MRPAVVITGAGIVTAALTGSWPALGVFLAASRSVVADRDGRRAALLAPAALAALLHPDETRRLSRVCQLSVAAARLAMAESGYDAARGVGLVIGTEFGDLRSTIEFADGYLRRGASGLSPLLFPNTVMNAMAATTAIAVGAKGMALTFNTPTVAGELAVARGAAAVAGGRTEAILAGGVDDLDPLVARGLADLGRGHDTRGEGAVFLLLESRASAERRGAAVLGEIRGAAVRALQVRPYGVPPRPRARGADDVSASRAITGALLDSSTTRDALGWTYTSASGDPTRDAWEARLLAGALGGAPPPATSLAPLMGHHSGLGALSVAAGAWTAASGVLPREHGAARVHRGPGLVHGIARGGTHVALVVDAA
jgi:3-oxoacyl-[acyl-carrier-protein] synthase II